MEQARQPSTGQRPIRPLFPYYGSKWNMARYYLPPVPGLPVVEPFAGSAGYSLFHGVQQATLVDKDPVVVGLWRYLTQVSPEEILRLPDLPEVGDSVDNYAIPEEAKWLIGFWLNRGSAVPKKSRTAYSARTDKAQLNWGPAAKARIAESVHRVSGWSVIEGDYTQSPALRATWFVDPPYGDKGRFYRIPFSQFAELGEWCSSRAGRVIACEGAGAEWLPFKPLGVFKTSKGRAAEVAYQMDHAA